VYRLLHGCQVAEGAPRRVARGTGCKSAIGPIPAFLRLQLKMRAHLSVEVVFPVPPAPTHVDGRYSTIVDGRLLQWLGGARPLENLPVHLRSRLRDH
jgi:hypothetical protein